MMVNLYKPQSCHHFEQSLALSGLISLKPKNFFPQTAGVTCWPIKQFSKACAFIARIFLTLPFLYSSIIGSTDFGRSPGKPQARHIPPPSLFFFLSFFIINFSYCIFIELMPFSPFPAYFLPYLKQFWFSNVTTEWLCFRDENKKDF